MSTQFNIQAESDTYDQRSQIYHSLAQSFLSVFDHPFRFFQHPSLITLVSLNVSVY